MVCEQVCQFFCHWSRLVGCLLVLFLSSLGLPHFSYCSPLGMDIPFYTCGLGLKLYCSLYDRLHQCPFMKHLCSEILWSWSCVLLWSCGFYWFVWAFVSRYEALFFSALAMVLFSWVLVESAVCNSIVKGGSTSSPKWEKLNANFLPEPTGLKSSRVAVLRIELLDTRIALCFVSSLNLTPSVQRRISKCFCHDCCLFLSGMKFWLSVANCAFYLLLKTSWGPIINSVTFSKYPVACFNLENNMVLELWTHLLKRWKQKTSFLLTDWYSAACFDQCCIFWNGQHGECCEFWDIVSLSIHNHLQCKLQCCFSQILLLAPVDVFGLWQRYCSNCFQVMASTTAFLQHEKSF